MVTCVDDVIEELTPIAQKKVATSATLPSGKHPVATSATAPAKGKVVNCRAAAVPEVKLSIEEALVLRQVPESGATVDAVARDAQLPVAKTNALLVALRLKGRVRFLPGNRVASR